jgi:heme/copper-type cytochrome/quinol oxidase subunit 4
VARVSLHDIVVFMHLGESERGCLNFIFYFFVGFVCLQISGGGEF